uniref:Uncharacterized protein n=1 Tax=Anguilla anguilla TaxID=7936 RepID=A0A0E9UAC6_ANGAN
MEWMDMMSTIRRVCPCLLFLC